MGGLNTSLLIGVQALQAAQGALNATSNNIANANSPGYTREVPQLSENRETVSGGSVEGGGVTLDRLESVRDEMLNLQIQRQTSLQSRADTQSSSLQEIQSYFTTTGGDIASALSSFSSSLARLSANPADTPTRQGVLSSGENLAKAFNATANILIGVRSDANTEVTQTVAQINSLTKQIALLNGQVHQLTMSGQDGGTVQDQRDELVQQLSKLTDISVTLGSDGETITNNNGAALVVGTKSYSWQTSAGSDGMQRVFDASSGDITSSIQEGQLGGAIQTRDRVVVGFLSRLNTLATQFAASFNAAQAKGFDFKGNAGQDFFTVPVTGASGIQVAIRNSQLIASSSDKASGSNGNVANLSAVLTDALPNGQSPVQDYAGLVENVGTVASDASMQSDAIGKNLRHLANQRGSVSGVNIDEEATNLIRFQTAYEAAARVVNMVQRLDSITLNMVS